MDAARRQSVKERAADRCEYCRLRQRDEEDSPFHVEHIIARQHGGTDDADNLALACCWCNAFKGPNLAGIDPDTGNVTRLFHPRRDAWVEHFRREGAQIVGKTEVGRTTAWLLHFNEADSLAQRTLLLELGVLD